MQKGVLDKLPPEHDANAETITVRRTGEDTVSSKRACRSATC